MWSALLAVGLAAAPLKLASPGLNGVQLSKELATYYSDHLAQLLVLDGLQVMTATEINQMIGLERQKQMLGCADEGSSCMAELANALGVDGIITGSIGKFSSGDLPGGTPGSLAAKQSTFQINLKVVAAADGHSLGIYSGTADTEGAVLAALKVAASSIADQVFTATGHASPKASSGSRRIVVLVPGIAGVLGVGTGFLLLGLASGNVSALKSEMSTLTVEQAMAAVSTGTTEKTAGFVALAVGGVALVAAVLLFVLGVGS